MHFTEYFINNRQFTVTSSLSNELNFQHDKNYLFELPYLQSLAVIGERAAEFLQGQLSCDMRQVTGNMMRQGAMCNLKGRILALLDIIDWHELQLILPRDLLGDTQNSLHKTAMLSRVKLEPTAAYQFYGFYLLNPNDLLPAQISLPVERFSLTQADDRCCYNLGDNLFICLIKNENASSLTREFIHNQQFRGSLAWHHLQLRHKQVLIYPETRGLFLPHRLDLHRSGYLSFDKGCYKGQEIIARTHYRAKLKHGLRLFTIETDEPLLVGKNLLDPVNETEIGELIDFSPQGNNHYLIATSILLDHPTHARIEGQENSVRLDSLD